MLTVVAIAIWLAGAVVVLTTMTPGARSSRELAIVVCVAVCWPLVLLALAWSILVSGDDA